MFTHEQDALLTDVDVNEDGMLTFDVNQLTTHLIRLLHDRNLRQRIGLATRLKYDHEAISEAIREYQMFLKPQ